jgi:hypothetical protein
MNPIVFFAYILSGQMSLKAGFYLSIKFLTNFIEMFC